ncbi:Sodium-coupled monocarboxylate transporter 2 [Armadillidium vulgare]|nr:Sodium-coupled monocarboxylate transporter 2 [Armadillidium vulgare]
MPYLSFRFDDIFILYIRMIHLIILSVCDRLIQAFREASFLNCRIWNFHYSFLYSSCQTNLQRICSVKSLKYAKRVISYNIFGTSLMYFLIYSCGIVAYSTYVGCDPMALGIIKKKEQIIPYFVMDKLNYIGLPGIFVGTIIGASMR